LRSRTIMIGLVALIIWAAFSLALPLAETRVGLTLFGLPLRAALSLPVALPAFVLVMFWFAFRQNREDERSRDNG
jgi:putative solute:sodium symporter small subunit